MVSSLLLGGLVSCGGSGDVAPQSQPSGSIAGSARTAVSGAASPGSPADEPRGSASSAEAEGTAEPPADRIELGREVEPWLVAALTALEGAGKVNLDLPIAMHLPVLASPRSDFITPRQLIGHTAHLGACAYEDFLRANPGSDALKVQAFLVALGADDAPGSRPVWRRAHLDLMGWLIEALTGMPDLAAGLNAALGGEDAPDARMAESLDAPLTPVRGRISVLSAAHERIVQRFPAVEHEEDAR
ncbi:MAG: serine hydrolase domain-containing protein [Planctomycetota bacterium]